MSGLKIIVTHPTGNRNVRAVISAFAEADILAHFGTTIAFNPENKLMKLLPGKLRRELIRRSYPVKYELIRNRPFLELSRNILPKIGFKSAVAHESGFASVDKVYADLDSFTAGLIRKPLAASAVRGVYGYEDGALFSFRQAKALGLQCIYDLPIGYWKAARRLLQIEFERWPEWAPTLTGFRDSQEKLNRKDEELKLADKIFVASSFTARTLQDYAGKLPDIAVIPYGFPPALEFRKYPENNKKPLKLLFVGGLSQRKGIADLFQAVKNIGKQVSLTVIGRKTNAECAALDKALSEHTWIPSMPHQEILEQMRLHDVLVFPSLFEGFGMVITEAMSQGTPVITTDRTAGPDLITHEQDGWIVKAGSTESLQDAIENLLTDRRRIAEAGTAAIETAKKRPWEVYGQELTAAMIKHFND